MRTANSISSYAELLAAREQLKLEIKDQESQILDHPLVSIPTALFQGSSVKGSIQHSMESISLENYKKAAMSLISTVMLANKRTRKFFVAFIMARELVPFILDKVREVMKKGDAKAF